MGHNALIGQSDIIGARINNFTVNASVQIHFSAPILAQKSKIEQSYIVDNTNFDRSELIYRLPLLPALKMSQ